MILSESKRRDNSFVKNWGFSLSLLLISLFVIYLSSTKLSRNLHPVNIGESFLIESDIESSFDSTFFLNNQVSGVKYLTDEVAHSGKYSIKLDGDDQYALNVTIKNPRPNINYVASVWVKMDSKDRASLVVSGNKSEDFYLSTDIPIKSDAHGWTLLELPFTVPEISMNTIIVYVFRPKNYPLAFFDDIKVEKILRKDIEAPTDLGEEIQLNIGSKGLSQLAKVKDRAFKNGILIVEDDDWVQGAIQDDIENVDVKLRYKGDWLDHLKGDKSSFRIKVKDPNSWRGMMTFSVQSPETRYFLHEWFYHEFLRSEDVLTPRYDFINLKLNQKNLGVYAFEEHFDKQIVEHSNRREGPILKLAEDLYWDGLLNETKIINDGKFFRSSIDDFWRSDIRGFKEGRMFANEKLKKSFELGQNLLAGWKYKKLKASEVFDVEKLAKYYAITDICRAYHGISWHNQRFYYNPVLSKLEPIGYDGFGSTLTGLNRGPFIGYFNGKSGEDNLFDKLFVDEHFVRYYNAYISKYSDEIFLKHLMYSLQTEIHSRLARINVEFPEYIFNPETIIKQGKNIQIYLSPGDVGSLLVRASNADTGKKKTRAINRHYLGLDILGYSTKKNGAIIDFENRIFLPARNSRSYGSPIEFNVPDKAKFIVYQVAGLAKKYYAEIVRADFARNEFPRKKLEQLSETIPFDFIKRDSLTYYIPAGDYTMDKDLILPKDYQLIIEGGASINVINKSKILVNGPVISKGSKEEPVVFNSSDNSAQGFTVLQAKKRSFLKHTHFKNFNTLNYEGWNLTGAVTFYESDLTMVNCSVTSNSCEDALNTIRCDIDIDDLFIADTYSDGFDADFCTGIIRNAACLRTGNDGFDFSGSELIVDNCSIKHAGDKGISIGENANVTVKKAEIQSCNIGVASKDLSVLNISNIALVDCNQGFAVYQKKPEFGPANMIVSYYTLDKVRQPYLIEHGSMLKLKGREIKGE